MRKHSSVRRSVGGSEWQGGACTRAIGSARRSLAWADARQIDSEPSDEMLMSIGRERRAINYENAPFYDRMVSTRALRSGGESAATGGRPLAIWND
jgi:hypothetical protein